MTTPSTPATPRRPATINRSFTVPSKLATTSRSETAPTAEIGATKDVETLYVHPSASIVKFTTTGSSRPSTPRTPGTPGAVGTLAWTSPTERTLAAGPLEIYRVPGSVSFLHSGSLLHAILPRSLCWCVDGVSKFAMRVLPDTYYRIELPGETPEDLEKAEELKVVLAKVLFYERTACPFSRGIEEELPSVEEVTNSRRKSRRVSQGLARRWRLERGRSWRPEDGEMWEGLRKGGGDVSEAGSSEEDPASGAQSGEQSGTETDAAEEESRDAVEIPSRPTALTGLRAVTAPAPLAARPQPVSRIRNNIFLAGQLDQQPTSPVPSSRLRLDPDRLRTFQPIPTDMPPSPPDSSAGLDALETHATQRAVDVEVQSAEPAANTASEANGGHPLLEGGAATECIESLPSDILDADVEAVAPKVHEYAANTDAVLEPELEAEAQPALEKGCSEGIHPAGLSYTEATSRDHPCRTHQGETRRMSDITTHEPEASHGDPSSDIKHESPAIGRDEDQQPNLDGAPLELDQSGSVEARLASQSSAVLEEAARDTKPQVFEDPYAAIQARILARRSIGGTFLVKRRPSRTASSSGSSSSSSVSVRSPISHQQNIASALVKTACAVCLGPPAHLVAIMLKIAAQVGKGALGFGRAFVFETPRGSKIVPGSFNLESLDAEDFEDEDESHLNEDEDDFGVPLRSPVRLAAARQGGWDGGTRRRRYHSDEEVD